MPTIKAKVAFSHDLLNLNVGDTADVSAATARDLKKAGLIESYSGSDQEDEAEKAAAKPAESTTKMAGDLLNKRAPDPVNKTAVAPTGRR